MADKYILSATKVGKPLRKKNTKRKKKLTPYHKRKTTNILKNSPKDTDKKLIQTVKM